MSVCACHVVNVPQPCDNVTVSITVENTGGMDGDEVVQVYIKHVNASVPVPQVRRTCNF